MFLSLFFVGNFFWHLSPCLCVCIEYFFGMGGSLFCALPQTPAPSSRAADMTLTERQFFQVLVPAGIFILATEQPSP